MIENHQADKQIVLQQECLNAEKEQLVKVKTKLYYLHLLINAGALLITAIASLVFAWLLNS